MAYGNLPNFMYITTTEGGGGGSGAGRGKRPQNHRVVMCGPKQPQKRSNHNFPLSHLFLKNHSLQEGSNHRCPLNRLFEKFVLAGMWPIPRTKPQLRVVKRPPNHHQERSNHNPPQSHTFLKKHGLWKFDQFRVQTITDGCQTILKPQQEKSNHHCPLSHPLLKKNHGLREFDQFRKPNVCMGAWELLSAWGAKLPTDPQNHQQEMSNHHVPPSHTFWNNRGLREFDKFRVHNHY